MTKSKVIKVAVPEKCKISAVYWAMKEQSENLRFCEKCDQPIKPGRHKSHEYSHASGCPNDRRFAEIRKDAEKKA